MSPLDMTPEMADFMARCFVNGSERHVKSDKFEPITGEWSVRFRSHPWVRQAEQEGWGRDLRSTCILAARQRILRGVRPVDIKTDDVMPKREWIDYFRDQARRGRKAYEWRQANPSHQSIRGLSQIDPEAMLRRLGIKRPAPAARPHSEAVDRNTGEIT